MDKPLTFNDFVAECVDQGFTDLVNREIKLKDACRSMSVPNYVDGEFFDVPTNRTMTDFKDEESCS